MWTTHLLEITINREGLLLLNINSLLFLICEFLDVIVSIQKWCNYIVAWFLNNVVLIEVTLQTSHFLVLTIYQIDV